MPPSIYSSPLYESPTRADPDDLLLLPGDGFTASDVVVYQAISDTTQPLTPPLVPPRDSTASSGIADIASVANTPFSLTIHLPVALTDGQSYALWVRDLAGEWSNGVKVNDARPIWITPDRAYVSAPTADLPRTLKVVGRNLQPSPNHNTQVRLIGPTTYTLTVLKDDAPIHASVPAPQITRYVAQAALPARMLPGTYRVQISRDGISWVALMGMAMAMLSA